MSRATEKDAFFVAGICLFQPLRAVWQPWQASISDLPAQNQAIAGCELPACVSALSGSAAEVSVEQARCRAVEAVSASQGVLAD